MERIKLNPLGGMGAKPPALKMPGSQPVHMASRVGMGGLHSYLGHFAQGEFLRAGHNTSGRLTASDRRALPSKDFAAPGAGKDNHGKGSGSYPIPDKKHARLALAMVSKYGSSSKKAEVRAAVHRKYPGVK